ncbi:MAG: transcription antitermination protein NusB [Ruminococcus sp.]|nr:transcription antitermination protein NusB [Ruminococcus sp.]
MYFEKLFRDDGIDEIYSAFVEADSSDGELEITQESVALAKAVESCESELDEIISRFSKKRAISRIPKINLALLRLSLYEAVYVESVPENVAISEAVALAQKYTYDSDVGFINGVLGSYSRSEKGDGDDTESE